jgi:hypothetical protein
MKFRRAGLFLFVFGILLGSENALACTVGRTTTGIGIPMEVVANAEVILRVTALGYALDPSVPSISISRVPNSTVRFRLEEIVKGAYAQKEIVLPGYLSDRDDWNDRPAPYDFIRPGGRHGNCFADTYRQGGQFLLALKRNTAPSLFTVNTEMTVNWYALGPVNEQLRSERDPWLLWVRAQVSKK